MNDEERLEQKLRAIEALFAGATTPGEREAADRARSAHHGTARGAAG